MPAKYRDIFAPPREQTTRPTWLLGWGASTTHFLVFSEQAEVNSFRVQGWECLELFLPEVLSAEDSSANGQIRSVQNEMRQLAGPRSAFVISSG